MAIKVNLTTFSKIYLKYICLIRIKIEGLGKDKTNIAIYLLNRIKPILIFSKTF